MIYEFNTNERPDLPSLINDDKHEFIIDQPPQISDTETEFILTLEYFSYDPIIHRSRVNYMAWIYNLTPRSISTSTNLLHPGQLSALFSSVIISIPLSMRFSSSAMSTISTVWAPVQVDKEIHIYLKRLFQDEECPYFLFNIIYSQSNTSLPRPQDQRSVRLCQLILRYK